MKSLPKIPDPEELPSYFLPPENRGFRQVLILKTHVYKFWYKVLMAFCSLERMDTISDQWYRCIHVSSFGCPREWVIFLYCLFFLFFFSVTVTDQIPFLTLFGARWMHEISTVLLKEWRFKCTYEHILEHILREREIRSVLSV